MKIINKFGNNTWAGLCLPKTCIRIPQAQKRGDGILKPRPKPKPKPFAESKVKENESEHFPVLVLCFLQEKFWSMRILMSKFGLLFNYVHAGICDFFLCWVQQHVEVVIRIFD